MGLVYWYSTSDLFAEEAAFPISNPPSPSEETTLPTLDTIRPARRQEPPPPPSPSPSSSLSPDAQLPTSPPSLSETDEEASQQGAYNEETGEINWDCPCLGGMAHGPCGEQFRAAFSCFVYSKEEPKGMDCIENFKAMQTCFRDHPDIYGGEIEGDDEEEEAGPERAQGDAGGEAAPPATAAMSVASPQGSAGAASPAGKEMNVPSTNSGSSASAATSPASIPSNDATVRAKAAADQVQENHGEPTSESDEMVPKASHDAR
ncbi:MAG: hypothetical protein Q9164_005158 [Protoblastenia rupestris]